MGRSARAAAAGAVAAALLALWLLRPDGEAPEAPATAAPIPAAAAPPRSPAPRPAAPGDAGESAGPPALIKGMGPRAAPGPAPEAPPAVPAVPSVVLEGTVVGLRGEPVPDATVHLTVPETDTVRPDRPFRDSVDGVFSLMRGTEQKTGADGKFRFETPPLPRAGLIAWGGAHANTTVEGLSLLEDVKGFVLRMEPAGALTGRVVRSLAAADGSLVPLPDAAVTLLRAAESERWVALHTTRTDAEGKFREWGWPPGTYSLLVEDLSERNLWEIDLGLDIAPRSRGDGEAPRFGRVLLPGVRIPAEDLLVRVPQASAASLEGTVVLPDGSTPAAGARVRAMTRIAANFVDWSSAEAVTDSEGKFRVSGLEMPLGGAGTTLRIEADAAGRGVGVKVVPNWTGGSAEWIALQPRGTATLRGRVVDPRDRRGLAGVGLLARGSLEDPSGRGAAVPVEVLALTWEDGTFEAKGLPDRRVALYPLPGGTEIEFAEGPRIAVPDRVEGQPWEIVVEAFPRASVSGVVWLPDGSPAVAARVEAQPPGTAPGAAVTGEGGRFTLRGVLTRENRMGVAVARNIVLVASLPGYQPGRSSTLTVPPGESVEGATLALSLALQPLAGRVLDEEGKALPGASVAAVPTEGGSRPPPSLTGPSGHYRLEVPPGTPWKVHASHPGFRPEESEGTLPGDPIPDLVLRRVPPGEGK